MKGLRSFTGAYKVLGCVLPNCSDVVDPLECTLTGLQSNDKLLWDENLTLKFTTAQEHLSRHKSIVLPCPSDTKRGLGATLYVSRASRFHLAGFYSGKLRKHQVTWLHCEVEALSIAAAVKYFSPFIIQSSHPTTVLTDSKPLCCGEFSASPRVTSFLTTVSRYQVSLQHLAGSPTARFAPLSMTWKTPLCGASPSRTSSTISPVSHSPQGQPGYRSKAIVPTSEEFTPILNKALVLQRILPMFVMSSVILIVLPLLKSEFSWLNAVNVLFQLLRPSSYPGPC